MIVLDPALLDQVLSNIQEAAKRESRLVIVGPGEQHARFPVWLHVYDLSRATGIVLNNWLSKMGGFGAFHCGIEVLGAEWSFQAPAQQSGADADRTGLMCHHAKAHPVHVYKESVYLGESPLRVSDIWGVLLQLERQWLGSSYHAVRRNCTDFAEAFATELRVPESVPAWVHGIAKGYLRYTPLASVDSAVLPRSCASSVSGSDALTRNVCVSSSSVTSPLGKGVILLKNPRDSPEVDQKFPSPVSLLLADEIAEKNRKASADKSGAPPDAKELRNALEKVEAAPRILRGSRRYLPVPEATTP